METLKAVHVVLVSPSDVAQERQAFEDAIANANQVAFRRGVVFKLRRWEDVSPGYHEAGAQALIDSQLNIEQCDLLVGIFWNRFGVIDKAPYSRTAWEILRALEARKANPTKPEIKVYFCNRPPSASLAEAEERVAVLKFRKELEKTVIYREYTDVEDFRFRVFVDLIEYLDRVTGVAGSSVPAFTLRVTSNPRLFRYGGVTELLGDIHLSLAGAVPSSWIGDVIRLDINVLDLAGLSNRIAEDGYSDEVVVLADSVEGAQLARGRILSPNRYSGGVSFTDVGITVRDPALNQDLWIRGMRGLSGRSIRGWPTQAIVAVTCRKGDSYSSVLVPQTVLLGIPLHPTYFRVRLPIKWWPIPVESWPTPDKVTWLANEEGRRIVSFFTMHFREAFPGAFKNSEEEAGPSPRSAAGGDVLRITEHNIPKDFEIFVTIRDLPTVHFPPAEIGKAIAVETDDQGRPLNRPITPSPLLTWNRWESWSRGSGTGVNHTHTQTPLVQINRKPDYPGYYRDFNVGWKLVSSSTGQQEREFVFGVVLVGPKHFRPPREIGFTPTLGPTVGHFVHPNQCSVPSFLQDFSIGLGDRDTLVLETGEEPSLPGQ